MSYSVIDGLVNVSDKDSIADIRHFVGLHDIEQYKQRLANFVKKDFYTRASNATVI